MRVRIVAYAVLCAAMILAKSRAGGVASGDQYDLIANVLGLVLLLPWVIVVPFFESISINSTPWFLGLSCLNIALWLAYEKWVSVRESGKADV
jgi:hypothetical protein